MWIESDNVAGIKRMKENWRKKNTAECRDTHIAHMLRVKLKTKKHQSEPVDVWPVCSVHQTKTASNEGRTELRDKTGKNMIQIIVLNIAKCNYYQQHAERMRNANAGTQTNATFADDAVGSATFSSISTFLVRRRCTSISSQIWLPSMPQWCPFNWAHTFRCWPYDAQSQSAGVPLPAKHCRF